MYIQKDMALGSELRQKLNYLWRLIATAISFVSFGIGGVILSFILFPIVNLVVPIEKRKIVSRKIVYRSFRFFLFMMEKFGMFEFDLTQATELLAQYKGKVIVANHPSLIDVVVLISVLPHADCIVKQALWKNPFLKGVVKAVDYIKNSDDPEMLIEACRKSLSDGYSLVIFPEGTRSEPEKELKLHRGASHIALRCGADIIPVRIFCNPSTLTKNEPWYSIPSRKANFRIEVEKPIRINQIAQQNTNLSINARRLTKEIKSYLSGENKNYA